MEKLPELELLNNVSEIYIVYKKRKLLAKPLKGL
jgi:hypothetical protein